MLARPGQDVGDAASRAKSIEARAYATAQVASTTTTGARPHVEGVRIYTREAAKLVQTLLVEAGALGAAPSEAPAGDAQVRPCRLCASAARCIMPVAHFAPKIAAWGRGASRYGAAIRACSDVRVTSGRGTRSFCRCRATTASS